MSLSEVPSTVREAGLASSAQAITWHPRGFCRVPRIKVIPNAWRLIRQPSTIQLYTVQLGLWVASSHLVSECVEV
jgi:hypothetical protein